MCCSALLPGFFHRVEFGCFPPDVCDRQCARRTKRWPLCVFYGMLNTGCTNSWIIHSENMIRRGGKSLIRRKYMQVLARSLIVPWAQKRLTSPFLSRTLKTLISIVCDLPSPGTSAGTPGTPVADSEGAVVRCVECPGRSDRKTRHRCNSCRQPVCPRHFYPVCANCLTRYAKFFGSYLQY